MDATCLLTHAAKSVDGILRSGQMNMGEPSDGIAHGVVEIASGSIAAVDVGQYPPACGSGASSGEGFDAIAQDHHDITLQAM